MVDYRETAAAAAHANMYSDNANITTKYGESSKSGSAALCTANIVTQTFKKGKVCGSTNTTLFTSKVTRTTQIKKCGDYFLSDPSWQ